MKEAFAVTGKRQGAMAEKHDCKKYLVPYFKLPQKNIDVIEMRASCSRCHRSYTLIYLLKKVDLYAE